MVIITYTHHYLDKCGSNGSKVCVCVYLCVCVRVRMCYSLLTVAVRVQLQSIASSPNTFPGPMVQSFIPSLVTSTLPSANQTRKHISFLPVQILNEDEENLKRDMFYLNDIGKGPFACVSLFNFQFNIMYRAPKQNNCVKALSFFFICTSKHTYISKSKSLINNLYKIHMIY